MGRFNNFEKKVIFLTGFAHAYHHAVMLLFPPVLMAVKEELGASVFALSVVYTISGFLNGLGALPSGFVIDRFGSKKPLTLNLFGVGVGAILVFLSRDIFTLGAGLGIVGFFSSAYHPSGLTLISHTVRERTRALGFHGIAGSIGLAIGPVSSGFLGTVMGWRYVFLVFGVIGLLLACCVYFFLHEHEIQKSRNRVVQTKVTRKSILAIYFSITILYGMSYAGFTTFIPTHFSENASHLLSSLGYIMRGGVLTSLVLLAGIFGQYLGGIIGSRVRLELVLVFIILFNIVPLFSMTWSKDLLLFIVTILFGVIHFSYQPIQNSLLAKYTSDRRRGLGYGIQAFLSFGVGSTAASLSGYITDALSVRWVFATMGGILIPALILAMVLYFVNYRRKL